jgi:DNA polymerase elongation subunit (family B)
MKIDEIESIEYIGNHEECLYDIGMEESPHTFFANGILVHNSAYLSNKPLLDSLKITDEKVCKENTISLAKESVGVVNKFYDSLMFKVFNCKTHCIKTAGETIGRTGIWLKKKRYCIHKIYDLEKEKDVDKFHIKGLDVVRSSFPTDFKKFMNTFIDKLLRNHSKEEIDNDVLNFKLSLKDIPIENIAKNSSVKEISKFEKARISENSFAKGTPAHVKAAIGFNDYIKSHGIKKIPKISDGEKIKWVYLKNNSMRIETLAFRGHNDPVEILEFIKNNIDRNMMFEHELQNKLELFYTSLKWDFPNENDVTLKNFFEF